MSDSPAQEAGCRGNMTHMRAEILRQQVPMRRMHLNPTPSCLLHHPRGLNEPVHDRRPFLRRQTTRLNGPYDVSEESAEVRRA